MRWLQRNGYLQEGVRSSVSWSCRGEKTGSVGTLGGPGFLELSCRSRSHGEEWEDLSYRVTVERTPCNYGGSRPWFLCPASGCGRRVAILYGGRVFACRKCHGLAYQSQQEDRAGRLLLKAQNIREKLGGSASMIEDFPEKPKGMHWKTYSRLCLEAREAEAASCFGLLA